MYDPYAGTVIGADGRRYDNDDEDIPTSAPDRVGKLATTRRVDAVDGRVDDLEDRVDDHETRITDLEA